ncbi:MAG: hypothetical protein ABIE92_13375 [bacterium]
MKLRGFIILFALTFPWLAFGGRLMSISGAERAQDDYAILALHFDQAVPYTIQEVDGGRALRLSVPGTYIETAVEKELNKLRNRLIRNVHITNAGGKLELEFVFSNPMQSLVWETRNPFSLVLDISALKTAYQAPAPQHTEPAAVPSPAPDPKQAQHQQQNTTSPQQRSYQPQESADKHDQQKTKPQQQQNQPQIHTGSTPPANKQPVDNLSPHGHYLKALEYKSKQNYKAALEHLQESLEDPSLYAKSTAEMAAIYRLQGRDEDEIAAWERLFMALQIQGLAGEAENPSRITARPAATGGESIHQAETEDAGFSMSTLVIILLSILTAGSSYLAFNFYQKVKLLKFQLALNAPEEEEKPAAPEPIAPPPPKPKKQAKPKPAPEPEPELELEENFEEELNDEIELESPEPEKEGAPWGGENLIEEGAPEKTRSSEETATEVYALSEQGFTIQEIAEKLELGQDEVRLILNLQREDSKLELEEVE